MSEKTLEDRFITHLLKYAQEENRAALAALRTGLGKRPGEAPRMFPYLAEFIPPGGVESLNMRVAFLVAPLFASHPEHVAKRSLGLALWHATKRDQNPEGKHGESGVIARFTAALDAHPDDLPHHLQGLVSLLASSSQGLDWYRFAQDLRGLLGDNEKWRDDVRLRWARDFFQGPRAISETEPNPETESNKGTQA